MAHVLAHDREFALAAGVPLFVLRVFRVVRLLASALLQEELLECLAHAARVALDVDAIARRDYMIVELSLNYTVSTSTYRMCSVH